MEDDRLLQALSHANYMATIVQQRENLKLRFANATLHAHNGGTFTVSPSLLAMVDLLLRQGQGEAVLLDDKGVPVRVADLTSFFEDILGVYAEASNEYLVGWEQLRKARSVEAATI